MVVQADKASPAITAPKAPAASRDQWPTGRQLRSSMIPARKLKGNPLLSRPASWVTPPDREVQHVNEALIMPANVVSGESYRIDVAAVIGLAAMRRAAEAEKARRFGIGA